MAFIIGIAGGSGSGKTTFARKIMMHFNESVSILHMDSYYLPSPPDGLKTVSGRPNFDHPKAFDWDLLAIHLEELKCGNSISVPIYDFKTSRRTSDTLQVGPAKVVLFEGIFSLFDEKIRTLMDIMCFLHVDSDIRFIRRLHRDVQERGRSLESVIGQYYDSVRPMYNKFLDPQRQFADFIVGEETDNAAAILTSKVKDLLGKIELTGDFNLKSDHSTAIASEQNV